MKHLVKATNRKVPKLLPIGPQWFKAPRKGINRGTQTDPPEKLTRATQTEPPKPEPKKSESKSGKIYYCSNCGFKLFKEEDIHHRSQGHSTEYIFVGPRKAAATVDEKNRARCEICNIALGGFCNFAGDFTRPRIRFCRHLITKKLIVFPPVVKIKSNKI